MDCESRLTNLLLYKILTARPTPPLTLPPYISDFPELLSSHPRLFGTRVYVRSLLF